MVNNALRFVLSQDVSVVIPGYKSVKEVDTSAYLGNNFVPLSDEETRFCVNFDHNCCQDCGLCLPCSQKIDIASILRFHSLFEVYGLQSWAKKLYWGLKADASNCVECRECEPKCPYNLPIQKMLKTAHADLYR